MLSKKTIKKMYEHPLEVKLWNGNFNRCCVEVTVNRNTAFLDVCGTHPMLEQFVSDSVKNKEVRFFYNNINYPVPEELFPLVNKMQEAVKMTDEYAAEIYAVMQKVLESFYEEFCIN